MLPKAIPIISVGYIDYIDDIIINYS